MNLQLAHRQHPRLIVLILLTGIVAAAAATVRNLAPRVVNPITELVLSTDDDLYTRDMRAAPVVFEDPDRDALEFSVQTSDCTVAAVELLTTVLHVTPLRAGITRVTLKAQDPDGASADLSFPLTVLESDPNGAPAVADALPDQYLVAGSGAFTRNLEAPPVVFSDPDGDALTYEVSADKPEIVRVTLFGSLLTITPVSPGTARVLLAASDGKGKSASHEFSVVVRENAPPTVRHSPMAQQLLNQPVQVAARIEDDAGVSRAILYYRSGGANAFQQINMAGVSGNWEGAIPGAAIASRGVEYFIEAYDHSGESSRSPLFALPVELPDEGLRRPRPQPSGSEQTAYRLVSAPIRLFDPAPATVLEDDFGPYDPKLWRFFAMRGERDFVEYHDLQALRSGEAYWLLVREPGKTLDTGAGVTQPSIRPYYIPLRRGWNLVANPFSFAVPAGGLRLASDAQSPELLPFQGRWGDPDTVRQIEPFSGYAIFHDSTEPDSLIIDPQWRSNGASLLSNRTLASPDWQITITASCQQAVDAHNRFGAAAGAREGPDVLDRPEPPAIGAFVSLYFPHPEWTGASQKYRSDIRPAGGPMVQEWRLAVETSIGDVISLEFTGFETLPEAYAIIVIDSSLGTVHTPERGLPLMIRSPRGQAKALHIFAGDSNRVAAVSDAFAPTPVHAVLGPNYPNPFNPMTTIRFDLPAADRVNMAILDIRGRSVRDLISNRFFPAGRHQIIWDGRDQSGREAGSGLYFYRLKTGSTVQARRMLLLR